MTARRAIVAGRVQGVGFRFFAERAARELGRPRLGAQPAGRLASRRVAEGEDDAVDALPSSGCGAAPLGSRVDRVEVAEEPLAGTFDSFEITR